MTCFQFGDHLIDSFLSHSGRSENIMWKAPSFNCIPRCGLAIELVVLGFVMYVRCDLKKTTHEGVVQHIQIIVRLFLCQTEIAWSDRHQKLVNFERHNCSRLVAGIWFHKSGRGSVYRPLMKEVVRAMRISTGYQDWFRNHVVGLETDIDHQRQTANEGKLQHHAVVQNWPT